MNPRILMIIKSDPSQSHQPCEALRIAVGLNGVERGKVKVLLLDEAVKLLDADKYDLPESEDIENYLAMLTEWGTSFYVGDSFSSLAATSDNFSCKIENVSTQQIAEMIAQYQQFLVF